MVTFTRDGTTCLRSTFRGKTADGTAVIADALSQWAAQMPAGAATVDRTSERATLTACDPGTGATEAPNRALAALVYVASRDGLFAEVLQQGLPGEDRRLHRQPGSCATRRSNRCSTGAAADPSAAPDAGVISAVRGRVPRSCRSACRRRRRERRRPDQTTKYLASGWGTMIAEVLCSGSSWNSSVSFTPMRCSSSRSSSLAWSSRSGHAG